MSALVITRLSLKEAVSRKLVLASAVLSLAFVGLFALGFATLYQRAAEDSEPGLLVFAATAQTVLGVYAVDFLAAFLAMFLAVAAVSAETDSGLLHAVLARPLRRESWLVQRWLAFSGVSVVYVIAMTGALLAVAGAVAGYGATAPWRALGLLALEMLVLVSLGLLASTLFSTLTAGVTVFALFGLGWMGGIIEFIGDGIGNETMRLIGIASSLLIPSDALWRGASYYLQSPAFLAAASGEAGIPFVSPTPPSGALIWWSVGYVVLTLALAAGRFRRRDL